MKKSLFVYVIFLFGAIPAFAQVDTAWVRRYDGPGNHVDMARTVVVDDSGNAYVTGYTAGIGTESDYTTIKYNEDGDTAWVRRYNGPGNYYDDAFALAVDDSGNVYVTGESYGSGTDRDYATIKYYSNGDTAWVRRYNGPGNYMDGAFALAVDASSNVYVTGYISVSGTDIDYATIKYDSNGNPAWLKRYNGPGDKIDYAGALAVDGYGNVYVTGISDGTGTENYDYATIKYNSDGDTAWVRRYNGPGNDLDRGQDVAVDGSGSVYVTGESYRSGTDYDYATLKYNSAGDTVWVIRYDGGSLELAYALALDDSGNVYVTGYSFSSGETLIDWATIKYVQTPSGVKDETGSRERPSEFDLSQNYPNPFNPTTKIEFTLAKSGFVTLQIYDTLGRKVRTLVSEELPSGYKSVVWDGKNEDGKDVASGVYFYQLKVGDFSQPKKMALLK